MSGVWSGVDLRTDTTNKLVAQIFINHSIINIFGRFFYKKENIHFDNEEYIHIVSKNYGDNVYCLDLDLLIILL